MSWWLKDIKYIEQGKLGPCAFRINVNHFFHKHDEKKTNW